MRKFLEFIALLSKTISLSFLAAVLIWATVVFIAPAVVEHLAPNHGHAKLVITNPQRLASHLIIVNDEYRAEGLCTGTAIGPHAIMSASHCDEDGSVVSLSVDLTIEKHKVLRRISDGRDHIIWLIDGSPLKNIEPVMQATAKIGDVVTIYGSGGGAYPPDAKYGRTISCEDPSDADAAAELRCYSIPAIPGDSGSAIYNASGEIVGLVTYSDGMQKPAGTAAFTLNFTPQQLAAAQTFDGKKPHAGAKKKALKCTFNIFEGEVCE